MQRFSTLIDNCFLLMAAGMGISRETLTKVGLEIISVLATVLFTMYGVQWKLQNDLDLMRASFKAELKALSEKDLEIMRQDADTREHLNEHVKESTVFRDKVENKLDTIREQLWEHRIHEEANHLKLKKEIVNDPR